MVDNIWELKKKYYEKKYGKKVLYRCCYCRGVILEGEAFTYWSGSPIHLRCYKIIKEFESD